MAADYILEQQMEEIEEQRKDFIAETAATFVIVNGVDMISVIDAPLIKDSVASTR